MIPTLCVWSIASAFWKLGVHSLSPPIRPQLVRHVSCLGVASLVPSPLGSSTADDLMQQPKASKGQGWSLKRVFRRKKSPGLETSALLLQQQQPRLHGSRKPLFFDYEEGALETVLTPIQFISSEVCPWWVIHPNEHDTSKDAKPTPLKPQGPIWTRTSRGYAESIVASLLNRWTKGTIENLQVSCEPKSNILDLARGHFYCDATVDVDAIKFERIQFSGGRLETQRLAVNLYSFTFHKGHRFPKQFDFAATNVLFTATDLMESDCIRNGLVRLLTRILRNRGMKASKVQMESIRITQDRKLSCRGRISTGLTPPDIAFEVRTGLSTASRGHSLTFPGLEISLSPAFGIYFPVPEVSLDLGHSAQVHDLTLDPDNGLRISCQATITPKHTLSLLQSYAQSDKAYGSRFSIDVGRWLTRVGNFSA